MSKLVYPLALVALFGSGALIANARGPGDYILLAAILVLFKETYAYLDNKTMYIGPAKTSYSEKNREIRGLAALSYALFLVILSIYAFFM
jgi:hypothetical protein